MWSQSDSSCECLCAGAAPVGFYSLPMPMERPRSTRPAPSPYPYTNQPLIYYAETPEVYSKKQKRQMNSDKPNNNFVKAFRWYSQDQRVTKGNIAGGTLDAGFAAWLDQKYKQFLQDQNMQDTGYRSDANNILPPTTNQDIAVRKPPKAKGLQKVLRSPWRKRRASDKSPEGENGCTECKSSWRIILKPKSLTLLESETCTQKRSTTGGASSKVTVTSSDTQIAARAKTFIDNQELKRSEKVTGSNINTSEQETAGNTELSQNSQNTYVMEDKKRIKIKVHCECPVEKVGSGIKYKLDMSTQYDSNTNVANTSKNATATQATMEPASLNTGTSTQLDPNKQFLHPFKNVTATQVTPDSTLSTNVASGDKHFTTGTAVVEIPPKCSCICNNSNETPDADSNNGQIHQKHQDVSVSAHEAVQTSNSAIVTLVGIRFPLNGSGHTIVINSSIRYIIKPR